MLQAIKNLQNAVKNWWLLLLIGILCVGCGIAILTSGGGVSTVALILAIDMIASGILTAAFVITNRENIPAWGWDLILPILMIISGIILISNPAFSIILVICIFAAGALCKAIETIAYAFSLSSVEGSGWGWILAAGIICLLFAIVLFMNPLLSAVVANTLVGIALLVMGISSIVTSIQLHKVKSAAKKFGEAVEELNK